ncbi:hypothetical protein IW261DRAFT_1565024 [Armillaria novae-zelandiae]|uniref:Uncharacterized protein n=1 Tax=Armillaria novae-zelandiae TaxID=153914 RepID=A0AA39P7C6_9AGAR|nr:hypothetical protein IW261DRAFT_1565024 [Armillaria novae-zelandiae]
MRGSTSAHSQPHQRGPQVIVQPGLCTVFQDIEQTTDNDYCVDMTYQRPASKVTASLNRSGGFVNSLVSLCLSTFEDVQYTLDTNFCLHTTYRRLASEGMALLRWRVVFQMCTPDVRGPQVIASVLPYPSNFQDVRRTFFDNDFCLDTTYRHLASSNDVTRTPRGTRTSEEVWMASVWLKNGSLMMAMICDLQRRINVRRAPKMDGEKYGMARKDNEMRDQLKKGTPFEEDSGLGNRVGCLTHSATVFLCEQIVEI